MVDYKVIVYWKTKLFVLCIFTGGIKGNKSKPLNGFRMLSLLSLWLDYFVCHLIMGLEFHFPQIAWIFFLKNLVFLVLGRVLDRALTVEEIKINVSTSHKCQLSKVVHVYEPQHQGWERFGMAESFSSQVSGSFNFNIFQLFSKVFISFWSEGSIIQIKLGGNVWYDDCKYI